jgi:hypothetical protein
MPETFIKHRIAVFSFRFNYKPVQYIGGIEVRRNFSEASGV